MCKFFKFSWTSWRVHKDSFDSFSHLSIYFIIFKDFLSFAMKIKRKKQLLSELRQLKIRQRCLEKNTKTSFKLNELSEEEKEFIRWEFGIWFYDVTLTIESIIQRYGLPQNNSGEKPAALSRRSHFNRQRLRLQSEKVPSQRRQVWPATAGDQQQHFWSAKRL